MLTDAQWAMLEPLAEQCRPKGKTHRTICVARLRPSSGATRMVPNGGLCLLTGPTAAAQPFIRWARAGVWERLLNLVQERGIQLGMTFLDGTSVRASEGGGSAPKRGSQAQRDDREALGRSRGGYGTKACVIADSLGRAIAFRISPGQAHELPQAVPLLDSLPGVPMWVVGDRGYTSHAFREHVWSIGARPAIPPQRHEAPVACPDWIDNNRNVVERLWTRLKEWRAVATRYEKTASSFMGILCLAAALDWLKT